eukprot:7766501-Pyramimonas_sp.AAC.1
MAQLRLQMPSGRLEKRAKTSPVGHRDAKTYDSYVFSRVLVFPTLLDGLRRPRDYPEPAKKAPWRATQWPKTVPRRAKYGPMTATYASRRTEKAPKRTHAKRNLQLNRPGAPTFARKAPERLKR